MGTVLVERNSYDANVVCPNPAEPIRAGGGIGTPITIGGLDANGGVVYMAQISNLFVRQLGGVSQTLAASLSGNQITIQLGTDGGGLVTSTAQAVVNKINITLAVAAVAAVSYTGTGAGLAAISPNWTPLSAGLVGSIRAGFQALTNRTRWLNGNMTNLQVALSLDTFRRPWVRASDVADTIEYGNSPSFLAINSNGVYVLGQILNSIGSPTLSASTRYYVYCFVNQDGSTSVDVASTVQPEENGILKSGDPTQRYLCSFRTNAGSHVVAQTSRDGVTTLDDQTIYSTSPKANMILVAGSATTWTNVDMSQHLPAYVKQITVRYDFSNTNGSTRISFVRAASVEFAGSGVGSDIPHYGITNTPEWGYITLGWSPGAQLQYKCSANDVGLSLVLVSYMD